jgi:hypothetical protein
VPTPYPNIAQSITLSNGTTTVKGDKAMCANKGSKFALSNGDQPGTLGGVKSNVFMKEATWILYSFDVKLQRRNAARLTDPMYHNAKNTVNMAGEAQACSGIVEALGQEDADKLCEAACECRSAPRPQDCMGAKFTRENYTFRGNTPNTPGLYPEVSYRVGAGGSGMTPILSTSGRTAMGQAAPASVASAMGQVSRAPGTSLRFDFVKLRDPLGGIAPSNVSKYVEVKFPNETSFSRNQHALYGEMPASERRKLVLMSPEHDCACW